MSQAGTTPASSPAHGHSPPHGAAGGGQPCHKFTAFKPCWPSKHVSLSPHGQTSAYFCSLRVGQWLQPLGPLQWPFAKCIEHVLKMTSMKNYTSIVPALDMARRNGHTSFSEQRLETSNPWTLATVLPQSDIQFPQVGLSLVCKVPTM